MNPLIGVLALCGLVGAGAPVALSGDTGPFGGSAITVAVSSPAVAGTCHTAAGDCMSLTLPSIGPVGSTFVSGLTPVVITNVGKRPVNVSSLQVSDVTNGSSGMVLQNEMDICITTPEGLVVANGRLATGIALSPSVALQSITLGPGDTAEFETSLYAGRTSPCGTVVSSIPSTAALWSTPPITGPSHYRGTGNYATPSSLTNPAQGGSDTVTITVTYTTGCSGRGESARSTESGKGSECRSE